MMVILGLGGQEASARHARNTALAVSAIRPHMPQRSYADDVPRQRVAGRASESGRFPILSPAGIMEELHGCRALSCPRSITAFFAATIFQIISISPARCPKIVKSAFLSESLAAKDKLALLKNWDP